MNTALQQAVEHWRFVAPVLTPPANGAVYDALVAALDELLELIGEDEGHPAAALAIQMGELISAYDERHYTVPKAAPSEVLR